MSTTATLFSPSLALFATVDADTFHEAVSKAAGQTRIDSAGRERTFGETVHVYEPEEYALMECFLTGDGQTGFALKPTDEGYDLVSVFSTSDRRGEGTRAVALAADLGATTLDVMDEDGFLPGYYARFGFEEVGRDTWDDRYAPEGWSGDTPDIVYMRRAA